MKETSPTDELMAILAKTNARVTFDRRRNITHPCWSCGKDDVPRTLAEVGRYTRGGMAGDAIERPVCAPCLDLMGDITATVTKEPHARR